MANPNRVQGTRLYTGTLYLFFFFFKTELVPVGIQTISVIKKNHLHIQKNYHQSGVHQNLYTDTESHLHIQNWTFTFTNQSAGHIVMNPY